ncbi:amidohydrolase [Prochlorococcus sp. MIT 1223]|uniref:amidohydrolase n=1 Tax=Prochlorococcus sp. MIT 1223 TaxID=3096217 RepID=UPI002A750012|nr:amidohydrolase [Prochlorococcus sp. MIT 1223]
MTFIKQPSSSLKEFLPELLELRRHLHAHPELSGQEYQTAALVAGELKKYGWQVKEGVGGTGLIAELGSSDKPLVGLRVDMDALPVEERTNLDYASLNQGVMHACGHDFHTCIGLGVARVLASHQDLLSGIRILFQPAEEIAQGANLMRLDGATKDLKALFGVHVFPELQVGQIGIRVGSLTAAAGELEIEIIGNGGHGARPHQAVDSILIAARIVTGIQEAICRRLDALQPVVISFGKIQGGNAFNVIPDRVKLLGTVRCLDASLHQELPSWIESLCKGIASPFGGDVRVNYRCIAPPVYNDSYLTDLVEKAGIDLLGKENVLNLDKPSLGAEDFAVFLQDVPGTMFRLGVSKPDGCAPLHNGEFSPDERSLEIGIEVLTKSLLAWINNQQ